MPPARVTLPAHPVRYQGEDYHTLRQLDVCLGAVKGTAFRRFRRAGLTGGRDFVQLDPVADAALVGALIRDGIAYPSPPRVLLIRRGVCERLLDGA